MTRKQNNSGAKCGNEGDTTEKPNGKRVRRSRRQKYQNEDENTPRATLKKAPKWKTSGHYNIHGFWFKKFPFIHDRLVIKMSSCLEETGIPEWMSKGKTTLIQKDPPKRTAPTTTDP